MSGTNDPSAESGIWGVGIWGQFIWGGTTAPSDKDARYVNCFKQTANDAFGKRVYSVKRSGLQALETPQVSSIGTAILVWSGQGTGDARITAYGAVSSSIYNTTTRIATNNTVTTNISSVCTSITETTINNNPVLYLTAQNSKGWFYDPSVSSSIMQIVDANYPGNTSSGIVGFGAHMDGYAFQMDPYGGIHNSQLNTISTWPATGVVNANIYPDKGIGVVRWKQYIIGYGRESMEFFYNAGNAQGSPLSRVLPMAQKIGAVSADAITSISDNIFFCGSTSQSGLSIYMFDGNIQRISTPQLDAVLLLAGADNIKLTAMRDLGLSFILVKAANNQYAYCIEEKFWFYWTSSLGFVRFAGLSVGSTQVVYGVSETTATGKTYTINNAVRMFADDGSPVVAYMQLPEIDPGNGEHVSYEEAEIKGDVESSTSEVSLQWSDDNYKTFSNARLLDMSESIPRTTRLGGTKHPRSFSLTHTTTKPMRIEALRLKVKIG